MTAPALVMAGFLGALAIAAPVINAGDTPPRSVFLRLPADQPEPNVTLNLAKRVDGTWRLRIEAENFSFTTLCLAEARAIPRGHAHVLVDGVKHASAYHPVLDLSLPAGARKVAVILRGQDHRALLGERGLIKAETVVDMPET